MNSLVTHLECTVCGERHSHRERQTVCIRCGKALTARYDLAKAKHIMSPQWFRSAEPGMWKYAPVLPVEDPSHRVSLGERGTPLVRLHALEEETGLAGISIKDEGQLPTGSFKARGLGMAVSRARELGISSVCIPSAGNAGGALAAYAARAGLKSHVFLPDDTPEVNIKECIAYGAVIELVPGTISDAAKRMNERKKDHPEWFDVSTLKEPYRLEGKKTMGYELAEQLEWNLPDVILYPAGGGTGLIGMWKAFAELEEMGLIGSSRPRMVAVQSAGCAPVVRAFDAGKKESEFWQGAATVASGLRVPKAFADYLILEAVYASKGCAIAIPDDEILATMMETAGRDGFYCCPEGAATVAALKRLVQTGAVRRNERVLLFNTAAGVKYPEVIPDPRRQSGGGSR